MNRARMFSFPIPYQYGYPHRSTGNLDYTRPPVQYLPDDDDRFFDTRGEAGHYYDTQLGEAIPTPQADVVAVLNAHNDRMFALTVVSTAAVAISAILTVFRTLKLIARD